MEARFTKEELLLIIICPVIPKISFTDGAPGRIDEINELTEDAHARDSLTNSSKEQSGLIPGHACFAISQLYGSFKLAG